MSETGRGRGRGADTKPGTQGLPVIDDFDALVDLVIAHEHVFARLSSGPQTDASKSVDHESQVELPGLSVTNLTPEPWWTRPSADWIARRVRQYADPGETRPRQQPWVLLGRVVGNGPDHEPLVVDVQPLGWIGPSAVREAQRRYRRAFEPRGRVDE
ncbi:hypothetical protein KGA66_21775 [Actinocrinis puniceicyclus]|uniref:Uncharacterized protein n=1 Tax=Actinocrinis puniceicyclus TaxID=977794 RepID=A0A8J7WNL3_9ACTN|nr:DUF6098 family protein [Actinocrinis puniceicyclus]MBS2965696.1 hypothetical protein [Actinocrinis puniceicyclus]